jgi:DNA repair exonuclease SbcCD ATPase subunit
MIKITETVIIKKIYHISDIHIRRYDRHVEYDIVFNNLYEYLNKQDLTSGLIVITGDVLHAKDNLTPDCVIKCYKFLKSLSEIMPVILIAGNHDMVESNKHIKDSLESILTERSIDNLYYFKNSGIYKYGNIVFGVSSLLDNQFIKANDINDINYNNCIKIALYHGPVGHCATAVGVVLHGDKQLDDFSGYDYVLLGDIHKFQYLNTKDKPHNNRIAYASSLISQNFAETDIYHGCLVWDLVKKTSEYIIIDNPYRHMVMDIITGVVIIDNIEIDINSLGSGLVNSYSLPTNAKIRLNITDTDKEVSDKIKKQIKKKFPNITFYETFISKNEIINTTQYTINYNDLLNDFINKLSEEEIHECKQLFNKKLEEINIDNDKQLCSWNLMDLEFSNMFAYGENNKLDFTKLPMNDIVGLFAPNSHGKSSLIDIILFSLYDNFSRNVYSKHRTIPSYIVNNKKKNFETKIRFKLGGDIYTVHKKGILKGKNNSKTGMAITFVAYDLIKQTNDDILYLTRKDRFETQEEVNKIIGSYDDFCLTTLFLQNKEKNFYDMSSSDRKLFLYNMFSLDKFEKIYDIFKNEEKHSKIRKEDNEEKLKHIDIDNIIEEKDKRIKIKKKLNKKIEYINSIKKNIIKKKNKYIKQLNNVNYFDISNINYSYNLNDLPWLKRNLDLCLLINDNRMTFNNDNNISNSFINQFTQLIYSLNISIDITNINIDYNSIINKLIKKYNHMSKDYIHSSYEKYKKDIETYKQHEYKLEVVNKQLEINQINDNCAVCLKRKNIYDDYVKEKEDIKKQLDYLNISNSHIDWEYIWNDYNYCINMYDLYKKDLCNSIINHYNFMNEFHSRNNKLNKDNDITKYIEYLTNNIKYINNSETIKHIKNLDNKLEKIDNKLSIYNKELNETLYELAIYETKFNTYLELKEDIKNNNKLFNIHSALKKACHINGIPSKIISTRLNDIEERVNELISQFINKKINVLLDGNNIVVHIKALGINSDMIVNILGGMEMFIINIAFKIALANVSIIPKNKMLIIDEGVSVLDKNHIEKFDKIAQFLNSNYNNVILISHIDSLKDFISEYININKDSDGFSHINYI